VTHYAGYVPEWARNQLYDNIAPDFLAILDALEPHRNTVKAAWLIRQHIGDNGTALSLFDDWANRDGNPPRMLETIWKTTASMTAEDAENWQVPLPIPDTLRPVEPFNFAFDIISIKSNAKLPEANSVSGYTQKKSGETKRANTLLTIIEACLDQLHRDPCERGLATDMAKWTEATDNCLDAGTIRPILKQLSKNVDFDKQNKR